MNKRTEGSQNKEMMMSIKIYTTAYCPYCVRAKMLLEKKNLPFEEISVGNDPEMRQKLVELTGMRTVPQIFINDKPIGGFTELQALERSGGLSELNQAPSAKTP